MLGNNTSKARHIACKLGELISTQPWRRDTVVPDENNSRKSGCGRAEDEGEGTNVSKRHRRPVVWQGWSVTVSLISGPLCMG